MAIHDIEDAIVAALKAAGLSARAFHLAPDAQNLEREVTETPVALVAYAGSEAAKTRTFANRNGMDHFFHIHLVARNLRSADPSAAVRGDIASAGIYQTLAAARAALADKTLGQQMQPLRPVAETAVFKTPRITAYRQEWKTTVVE